MNQDPLQLFTRQLAGWAEELLQRSRSPLRKVELAPEVSTSQGALRPDLVVWVNRDSCMAGGVILVPPREAMGVEATGRACAQALGLRHFVVWGASEIAFWEVLPEGLSRHKKLPAPPRGSDPAVYHQTLTSVLEELKYLTVAGVMSPGDLPPHYLVNLCQGALEDTITGLAEMKRIARSGGGAGEGITPPERWALDKAVLTLVRLTALLHYDQLPTTVQPEGLERAMFYALDTLPWAIRGVLLPTTDELPLPLEAAVRFHHLLRRLAQLGGCRDRQRLARLFELLLPRYQQGLGLFSCDSPLPPTAGSRLLVNISGVHPGSEDLEVAPRSALALFAQLRHLRDLPEAARQVPDLFSLTANDAPRTVMASLFATSPPVPVRERAALQAKLRISWPTRRFQLPSALPRWGWELLHLTGLAAAGARLLLRTPSGWLAAPYAETLLEILRSECSIRTIRRVDSGQLELDLIKSREQEGPLEIIGAGGRRSLERALLHDAPATLLALAVELPDPVWALIESRLLHPGTADNWPHQFPSGVTLFAQSGLGRALWQVVGQGQPLPAGDHLPTILASRRFPLPNPAILAHLQRLADEHPERFPGQARIDAELAPWFTPPDPPAPAAPLAAAGVATPGIEPLNLSQLKEVVQRKVFQDGIPAFPEHYLFAHFRPHLKEFHFTPPLLRAEQFFGQVTLEDGAGQTIQASSPETAQALQLVAATGRKVVSLPIEPSILEDILGRYLYDLNHLHEALQRQVHALVADLRQARSATRKLWNDLDLPGPELFLSAEN